MTAETMRYRGKAREDGGRSEFVQVSKSPPNLMSWEWNPEFGTRRSIDRAMENKAYVELGAGISVDGGMETHEERGEEENVISTFMRGPYVDELVMPQAEKVEEFCYGANLQSLRAEQTAISVPPRPVALLDERSFEDGIGRSRVYRGPLTALDLYKELEKPVRYSDPEFLNPI